MALDDATLRAKAEETVEIPVVQGPLRGPTPTRAATYYGSVVVRGRDRAAYEQARDYLCYGDGIDKHAGDATKRFASEHAAAGFGLMHSMFLHAEDYAMPLDMRMSDRTETVCYTLPAPEFLASEITLHWDPHAAIMTHDGIDRTPALGLGHEMTHVYLHRAHNLRRRVQLLMPMRNWESRDEYETIAVENQVAKALGEGKRTSYGALAYRVANPLTTRPERPLYAWLLRRMQPMVESASYFHSHAGLRPDIEDARTYGPGWNAFAKRQLDSIDAMHTQDLDQAKSFARPSRATLNHILSLATLLLLSGHRVPLG